MEIYVFFLIYQHAVGGEVVRRRRRGRRGEIVHRPAVRHKQTNTKKTKKQRYLAMSVAAWQTRTGEMFDQSSNSLS
jgi:hypothetical protein